MGSTEAAVLRARLTLARFRELGLEKIPSFGPLSISVPGAVDGWFDAAREVRSALDERAPRAGDRVRRRRLSR